MTPKAICAIVRCVNCGCFVGKDRECRSYFGQVDPRCDDGCVLFTAERDGRRANPGQSRDMLDSQEAFSRLSVAIAENRTKKKSCGEQLFFTICISSAFPHLHSAAA